MRVTVHGSQLVVTLLLGWPSLVGAQHVSVVDTVHNLSASGPGEVRSTMETEVCKFCHIPHNAVVPVPLWSRALSVSQYKMPAAPDTDPSDVSQPSGTSRLCLSCHDGTLALGKLGNSPEEIPMEGSNRLEPGRRGFLGTDLSGSHPISFRLVDHESGTDADRSDMGLKPVASILADESVRLDGGGMVQCTTCHEPHSDRYYREGLVPRFWVEPTVVAVCLKCHELR